MKKNFIAILAVCAFAGLVSGCAPIKMTPPVSGETLYVTPIENYSAQLVVSEEFQKSRINYRPSTGSWKARSFDVEIGPAATKSLVSHLSARIPGLRVGHLKDEARGGATIQPGISDFQFTADDKAATNTMAIVGVLGTGSKIYFTSTVSIFADLTLPDGTSRRLEAVGQGEKSKAMIASTPADAEEIIGVAIDDAAKKLSELIAAELRAKG